MLCPVPCIARAQTILPFILQLSGIFGETGSRNFLTSNDIFSLLVLTHTLLVQLKGGIQV